MVRDLSVRLTYHDYVALPDDGRRYEIHDGLVASQQWSPGRSGVSNRRH